MANDLPMSEREQLPSTVTPKQKSPRKMVEHTSAGSYADTEDLLDPIRRSEYHPELGVHGLRTHIKCEATESADGHSGPATHFMQMPGEGEDQREAVCAVHQARITQKALEMGHYDIKSVRIHPEDVQKHLAYRGIQRREVRTYMEGALYGQGMRGDDALFDRKDPELGKGGGRRTTAIEELQQRRTPEESADIVERALSHARSHGGRVPSTAPTIEVDGEDMTLGESYAHVAALRRQAEPENYSPAGVMSPEGKMESPPTLTRKFEFNKAGTPNRRGGRKKNNPRYSYDTSNENLPGYTEEEMKANPALRASQEERLASGIPLEGIKPRGFSKTNNRAIKVTLTGMKQEAPEVGIIERFETKRSAKKLKQRAAEVDLNTEAERLRKIEAKKRKESEGRNSAFRVDWDKLPRPE